VRWRVAGREVIDTQHAIRHYALEAPDLRRHGLKDAAMYFGFARSDREYVPGAEIWSTFATDPERIRRYSEDDVDEVDGLSRQLLPATFGLAKLLPRAYERVAADNGPAAVWELLMVRAYLHEGRAIAAPMPRQRRPDLEARSELFVRGVVGKSVRAAVRPLLPCVVADRSIAAANDRLALMPRLLEAVMDRTDAGLLVGAAHPYLASTGLFSDPTAADDATAVAREYVDHLLDDLRGRGCTAVAMDGEQVMFAVPSEWNDVVELQVADAARAYLPNDVQLKYLGQYEAVYARAPGTAITLAADGSVTLVGSAFRAARLERFGETFIQRAAPQVLLGDAVAVRQTFLDTLHLLRTGQIPLEELCVHVTLHKTPQQYRRGGTREEAYEVLLAAGVRAWRVGQRIRYFRAPGGEARLLQEGSSSSSDEADVEYYVQRLCGLYCQQFAQAFRREDFSQIFRLPSGVGPFEDDSDTITRLSAIHPIAEPVG
jgi:DNA polymerase elongation subunit (family B)